MSWFENGGQPAPKGWWDGIGETVRGVGNGLQTTFQNPLFQAGLGLATGGPQGMHQGIQNAQNFQQQRQQQQMQPLKMDLLRAQAQKAQREAQMGPDRYGKDIKLFTDDQGRSWGVQAGANGELKYHLLAPNGGQGQTPQPSQASTVPQLQSPGVPQPQASALSPFRGVKQVGDELIDMATGRPVRQAGDALRGGSYATEEGKALIADIKARDESIQSSRSKMPRLEIMSQLIESPEIYQGTGGNAVLELKKAASALGMDVAGVSGAEAIRSIGNQFALQLRNPAGGEGMPGALSDSDRNFLVQSTPNLSNTRDGNRLLVKTMIDLERHKMRENAEAQRFLRLHKSSSGLSEHMDQWAARNPALSKETRDAISRSTGVQYGARSGPASGPTVEGKQPGRLDQAPASSGWSIKREP